MLLILLSEPGESIENTLARCRKRNG